MNTPSMTKLHIQSDKANLHTYLDSRPHGAGHLGIRFGRWNLTLFQCLTSLVVAFSTLLPALHAADEPPSISTQPRPQSVSLGADVMFRVTAFGSGPVGFQWQHNLSSMLSAT